MTSFSRISATSPSRILDSSSNSMSLLWSNRCSKTTLEVHANRRATDSLPKDSTQLTAAPRELQHREAEYVRALETGPDIVLLPHRLVAPLREHPRVCLLASGKPLSEAKSNWCPAKPSPLLQLLVPQSRSSPAFPRAAPQEDRTQPSVCFLRHGHDHGDGHGDDRDHGHGHGDGHAACQPKEQQSRTQPPRTSAGSAKADSW